MTPLLLAAGVAGLVVAAGEWLRLARLLFRAAKRRSARLFSRRPLLGRWSLSSVEGLRSLAEHGPDSVLPRSASLLSSPHLPAVPPILSRGGLLLAPLAAIDPAPDYEAIVGGLELVVFTALITVSFFMVVGFIRRKLGE